MSTPVLHLDAAAPSRAKMPSSAIKSPRSSPAHPPQAFLPWASQEAMLGSAQAEDACLSPAATKPFSLPSTPQALGTAREWTLPATARAHSAEEDMEAPRVPVTRFPSPAWIPGAHSSLPPREAGAPQARRRRLWHASLRSPGRNRGAHKPKPLPRPFQGSPRARGLAEPQSTGPRVDGNDSAKGNTGPPWVRGRRGSR